MVALLKSALRLTWSQARRLFEQNRVRQGPRLCRDPQSRMRAGQKIRVQLEDKKAAPVLVAAPKKQQPVLSGPQPVLRFVDDQIVVVDKPAGLTTMRHAHEAREFGKRSQRFLPTTLAEMLPEFLQSRGKGRGRVIAVHRLDRDTSGLVVFARTEAAARHLGKQFREHTSDRTYQAIVRGQAKAERIESNLVADRGDGRRGTMPGDEHQAITHVSVVEQLGGFTLVGCRLETGRTHQVRIHLGERGTPICGERIYDRPLHGAPLPDKSGAERLALHAATLAIDHPASGKRMSWTAAMPADMERLLRKLRGNQVR